LVGFQKASALAMLGDKISAVEAERLGMIYNVFASEIFEEEVQKLALKLAKMPTQALGLIKKSLNQSLNNNLENQLALESKHQIEAAGTNDYAEGVAAFIEKRKPNFKGN
jgi:2-(1,2-epoxy-1,2-dihydrophenyl)acetyl-CoA isomerase